MQSSILAAVLLAATAGALEDNVGNFPRSPNYESPYDISSIFQDQFRSRIPQEDYFYSGRMTRLLLNFLDNVHGRKLVKTSKDINNDGDQGATDGNEEDDGPVLLRLPRNEISMYWLRKGQQAPEKMTEYRQDPPIPAFSGQYPPLEMKKRFSSNAVNFSQTRNDTVSGKSGSRQRKWKKNTRKFMGNQLCNFKLCSSGPNSMNDSE